MDTAIRRYDFSDGEDAGRARVILDAAGTAAALVKAVDSELDMAANHVCRDPAAPVSAALEKAQAALVELHKAVKALKGTAAVELRRNRRAAAAA